MFISQMKQILNVLESNPIHNTLHTYKKFVEDLVKADIDTDIVWLDLYGIISFSNRIMISQRGEIYVQVSYEELLDIPGVVMNTSQEISRTWEYQEDFTLFTLRIYVMITAPIPPEDIETLKDIGLIKEHFYTSPYNTLECTVHY